MIHQRHRWTERWTVWTDGQTTCDRKIALCTIVHCVVKTKLIRKKQPTMAVPKKEESLCLEIFTYVRDLYV